MLSTCHNAVLIRGSRRTHPRPPALDPARPAHDERSYVSDTTRQLPPEFADPQVRALLERGRSTGQVTSGEVRAAVEAAGIPQARMKAVLRSLSKEGVTVMVQADDSTEAQE